MEKDKANDNNNNPTKPNNWGNPGWENFTYLCKRTK